MSPPGSFETGIPPGILHGSPKKIYEGLDPTGPTPETSTCEETDDTSVPVVGVFSMGFSLPPGVTGVRDRQGPREGVTRRNGDVAG